MEELESNLESWQQLLNWKSYPDYQQLNCAIELCWKHLLKLGENKADVKSAAQLSFLTKQYADLQSISAMIRDMANRDFWRKKVAIEQERIDRCSFFILNVARHWFDYKLPKWLFVVSELQEYVFKKHNLPV